MVDWDALEEAGHDLTHCGMLMPGTDLYYCENCGAFMLCRHEGIEVFHVPQGSPSEQGKCRFHEGAVSPMLKDKLEALRTKDWERLKENI